MRAITLQDSKQLGFLLQHGAKLEGKLECSNKLYVIDGTGQDAVVYNYNDHLPDWFNCIPRSCLSLLEIPHFAPFTYLIGRQDDDAAKLTEVFRNTRVDHVQDRLYERTEDGMRRANEAATWNSGDTAASNTTSALKHISPGVLQSGADFSGARLVNLDFSCLEIEGADLSDAEFVGCKFENTEIRDTNLRRATFISCAFTQVTFDKVDGENFRGPKVSEEKVFEGMLFRNCTFERNQFSNSKLSWARLYSCTVGENGWKIEQAILSDCKVASANTPVCVPESR